MANGIKDLLRKILFSLGIDLTKNQVYDRQTSAIMKRLLKADSNCIDIGCHKGEVMDEILKLAPDGQHYGFEPIPEYYYFLTGKYAARKNVHILRKALSDSQGTAEFNWVKNAPAYSGLKQRAYAVKNPEIEKIQVELDTLDALTAVFPPIHLIKIDVEGAEMNVLNGAREMIRRHLPYIVFEFGLGASDFYGTKASDIFSFFNELNYGIFTLKGFLEKENKMEESAFRDLYEGNKEYYFIAGPAV
jgi:FkbM family methyltransferase